MAALAAVAAAALLIPLGPVAPDALAAAVALADGLSLRQEAALPAEPALPALPPDPELDARLAALPEPARGGVRAVVEAWAAADAAARGGAGAAALLEARRGLLDAALTLRDAVAATNPGLLRGARLAWPLVAIDLDGRDDTYASDLALVIDAGGSDTYLNNAGGVCDGRPSHAAAVIDLAGDDRYVSRRDCGVNGGAALGDASWMNPVGALGFLLDAAGRDAFLAGSAGTNGGAIAIWPGLPAVGTLVDAGGDDVVEAGSVSTNGGALGHEAGAAIGLLVAFGGDDRYSAAWGPVNGASCWCGGEALGGLLDVGGRDTYTDQARGTRTDPRPFSDSVLDIG